MRTLLLCMTQFFRCLLFRICGKKNTQSIVNQIIGKNIDNPLYIFTNRCRIDPPQDNRRTYDWHQEVFYTIPESNFIQTWAPLIRKTTKINGTIEVCASSHNEGIANADWVERDDKALQVKVKDSVVKKYEQKVIPLELGDILFLVVKLFADLEIILQIMFVFH